MSSTDFAHLMMQLGPFEERPHLAVGVSGGVDSLALMALLAGWLQARAGCLTVLSVDHGLRPEAAAECRRVGEIVAMLGARMGFSSIDHHILAWDGPKPATGIMRAARAARYRLLTAWCRAHHVLHLAVAHQADDQAETYLMREAHGSTSFGLAGMSATRMLDGVRLLRPLLSVPKARLVATALASRLSWIDDPSNRATRFERVRWRERPGAAEDTPALLAAAHEAGVLRDATERHAAAWLSRHGRISAAGYVQLDRRALLTALPGNAVQVLRHVLLTIGSAEYAPAPGSLEAAWDRIGASPRGGFSLGGCLFDWQEQRLYLFREAAACASNLPIAPGQSLVWDGRYRVTLEARGLLGAGRQVPADLAVAALGERGLANRPVPPHLAGIPLRARQALPGLWDGSRLIGWPRQIAAGSDCGQPESRQQAAEGSEADGLDAGGQNTGGQEVAVADSHGSYDLDVAFLPDWPTTSCGFTVVIPAKHTM